MPSRRLPNTMPAVIRTLKTARDTYKNTPNAADRAITSDQFAPLDDTNPNSYLNQLLKEASDVDLAQATQAPLTTEVSQAGARLTMLVSHFHQVLDLGITRGEFAVGARSYYNRDVTASSIPDLSSYDLVEEAAEHIVTGEAARATAEGTKYVAMNLPSAAEVAALKTHFHLLRNQSQAAQMKTDKEGEELKALYQQGHDLAVDICEQVEFFYRKDTDAGSFRQKCSRWGVVYLYDKNEAAPEPTPVVTPSPSSSPSPTPTPGQ